MNILFLTLAYSKNRGIYTDLIDEFSKNGHKIYVVTPIERKFKEDTTLTKISENINLLKVKTGNIQKVNILEKGISTLTLEFIFIKAIKNYLKDINFDLVLYATPPITFFNVVKYIKKLNNCKTYLMLKDIFPQNAVDLGMFKHNGLLYKFFRNKEKKLYNISDFIGCMSYGNIDYLLNHNKFIDKNKVELLPNTITPIDYKNYKDEEIINLKKKYNLPTDKMLFLYGGNLGKPQGIDFLIECIKENENLENSLFIIIGSGTEYIKVKNFITQNNIRNTKIYSYMNKDDYDIITSICDVGLVFLDSKFTIPNIPSRILTYMEFKMPIVAATDKNTDLKEIIEQGNFGLWCESTCSKIFISHIKQLSTNKNLRDTMGENARKYLEINYTSSKAYETIMKHFNNQEK